MLHCSRETSRWDQDQQGRQSDVCPDYKQQRHCKMQRELGSCVIHFSLGKEGALMSSMDWLFKVI